MAKLSAELFTYLNDPQVEEVLFELYRQTLKQNRAIFWHFLPKIYDFFTHGIDWKGENEQFYDDKYIPIFPQQGAFLYMQALSQQAKTIIEFGTSYGISTLYLAAAARQTGGKVITTELLPHKAKAARENFKQAGLADYIELREGDAQQTLRTLPESPDLILLDGWPNLVFPIFKILEPMMKIGTTILVDDSVDFRPSMQDYLNYVRNPIHGFASTSIKPQKGMEFTVKIT